jgi:hypothetical protein
MDASELRHQYMEQSLYQKELDANPLKQFETWYAEAIESNIHEPGAMSLATVDADDQPWQRIVLLKLFDEKGFVFFTNYESRKAEQITSNSQASLLFPWHALGRQLSITGDKVRLTILRNGDPLQLTVKVGVARSQQVQAEKLTPLLQGLRVENNPDGEGVLVVAVAPNSAAAFSGLRAGDVIVGANKRKVYDVKSLKAALLQSSTSVLLRVDRNGGSLYIVIR